MADFHGIHCPIKMNSKLRIFKKWVASTTHSEFYKNSKVETFIVYNTADLLTGFLNGFFKALPAILCCIN